MTIERLEQYADLRKEVALLKSRMESLEGQLCKRVSDTVKASLPEFPYTEHTVTVRGYSDQRDTRYRRIRQLYNTRTAKLQAELTEIEAWISGITDSKVRLIVEHKYVMGMTWRATARRVYGHPCESTARMKLERYLKNNL